MKTLKEASVEELEKELEARREPAKAPPRPLPAPDFSQLTELVVNGVNSSVKDGREPKDFEHYAYEAAMEAVYGPDFWKWRNKQNW